MMCYVPGCGCVPSILQTSPVPSILLTSPVPCWGRVAMQDVGSMSVSELEAELARRRAAEAAGGQQKQPQQG